VHTNQWPDDICPIPDVAIWTLHDICHLKLNSGNFTQIVTARDPSSWSWIIFREFDGVLASSTGNVSGVAIYVLCTLASWMRRTVPSSWRSISNHDSDDLPVDAILIKASDLLIHSGNGFQVQLQLQVQLHFFSPFRLSSEFDCWRQRHDSCISDHTWKSQLLLIFRLGSQLIWRRSMTWNRKAIIGITRKRKGTEIRRTMPTIPKTIVMWIVIICPTAIETRGMTLIMTMTVMQITILIVTVLISSWWIYQNATWFVYVIDFTLVAGKGDWWRCAKPFCFQVIRTRFCLSCFTV
jgi:hypothetical protein